MSEKQLQQPKRWLVPFPEKKAVTGHPCQDACNGNQKMGQLLHYFLCEASWELERQELDESCKVVKFTRSHEHILKRVHISEKSLIQFLKQFNAWNFVESEQYGKEFTVQAEPIQKAMYTPVFTKKVRRKSCTSTSENTTTSSEPGEVIESCKVYFLHEKVEALEDVQLYNFALEARVQALSEALEQESCKVVKLQEKVEAGKLYNFTLSTWIDAVSQALNIPSPIIDSVIDRDLRDSERESIASSLPFDAALSSSPQSEIDTQSQQGDTYDTTLLDRSPGDMVADQPRVPGEAIMAAESRTAGDLDTSHGVQPAPEHDVPDARSTIDEEWCNAETEHRLPAIPKTVGPPAGASPEQNRDASPRNVAVEADLGAVASVPIPPVPPEVTPPPKTIRATVVPERPKWDAQAMVVKAEELRDRPFSLHARPKEMKSAQKLFKRKSNLTLSDFEQAWKHWDTPWWRETNGPFTVTDLAAIPKNKSEMRLIIALEKLALPKPGNGGQVIPLTRSQGRTQQWRSSFDDPDYDMSAEFYPNQAVQ